MTNPKYRITENYFETIDTKEKAYWLGFLYADGNIRRFRIVVKISSKDRWILEKMKRDLKFEGKIMTLQHNQIGLYIHRQKMVEDLCRYGCIPQKSKVIELPKLTGRELYLAFLLGFFDGDGHQHLTKITCGSLKFLEQIKTMFNLPYKISSHNEKRSITEMGIIRTISGFRHRMSLGAKLFNELMENYSDSLPRKRKHFCTNEERALKAVEKAWISGEKKLRINKAELEKLVWEMPSEKIAQIYGVSGRLITKRCKQLGIEKPPRGYWQKLRRKR